MTSNPFNRRVPKAKASRLTYAPSEVPRQEYLRDDLKIVEPHNYSEEQIRALENAESYLKSTALRASDPDKLKHFAALRINRPGEIWLFDRFLSRRSTISTVLVLQEDLTPMAVAWKGLPLVLEAFRGRGIGPAFHLVPQIHDVKVFQPGAFTPAGKIARERGHALACRYAIETGQIIDRENLKFYTEPEPVKELHTKLDEGLDIGF